MQVELARTDLGILGGVGKLRNDGGGQNGHDHDDDQYFNECKRRSTSSDFHGSFPQVDEWACTLQRACNRPLPAKGSQWPVAGTSWDDGAAARKPLLHQR